MSQRYADTPHLMNTSPHHLEIPLAAFLEAASLLRRTLTRKADRNRAVTLTLRPDNQLFIDWGLAGTSITATGTWPSPLTIKGIHFYPLIAVPPQTDPIIFKVTGNELHINNVSLPCPPPPPPKLAPELPATPEPVTSEDAAPPPSPPSTTPSRIDRWSQLHDFYYQVYQYWDRKCALLGVPYGELADTNIIPLIVTPIIPVTKRSPESDKNDPFNYILLSVTLSNLFKGGLITFTDEGQLIISQLTPPHILETLDLNGTLKLRKLDPRHLKHLTRHRKTIFAGINYHYNSSTDTLSIPPIPAHTTEQLINYESQKVLPIKKWFDQLHSIKTSATSLFAELSQTVSDIVDGDEFTDETIHADMSVISFLHELAKVCTELTDNYDGQVGDFVGRIESLQEVLNESHIEAYGYPTPLHCPDVF